MDKKAKKDSGLSEIEKNTEKRKQQEKKEENRKRHEAHKAELNDIKWPVRVTDEILHAMGVLSLPDSAPSKWVEIERCKEKLELLFLIRESSFKKAYIVDDDEKKEWAA